jgi:hypothetical protein
MSAVAGQPHFYLLLPELDLRRNDSSELLFRVVELLFETRRASV